MRNDRRIAIPPHEQVGTHPETDGADCTDISGGESVGIGKERRYVFTESETMIAGRYLSMQKDRRAEYRSEQIRKERERRPLYGMGSHVPGKKKNTMLTYAKRKWKK